MIDKLIRRNLHCNLTVLARTKESFKKNFQYISSSDLSFNVHTQTVKAPLLKQ